MKNTLKIAFAIAALAMATPAMAATIGLDIEVGGVDYAGQGLDFGTVVTVKVVQSAEQANASAGLISVDFDGANPTVQDTTPTAAYLAGDGWGANVGWNWGTNFGASVDTDPQGIYDYQANKQSVPGLGGGTPGLGSSLLLQTFFGNPPAQPYIATFIVTFELTKATDVVLSGTWDGATLSGSETINVIPEPMTVGLLGLGGMLIARKRKVS